MFNVGSRQKMTDMDSKWATTGLSALLSYFV